VFWRITFPQILPATVTVVLIRIIEASRSSTCPTSSPTEAWHGNGIADPACLHDLASARHRGLGGGRLHAAHRVTFVAFPTSTSSAPARRRRPDRDGDHPETRRFGLDDVDLIPGDDALVHRSFRLDLRGPVPSLTGWP